MAGFPQSKWSEKDMQAATCAFYDGVSESYTVTSTVFYLLEESHSVQPTVKGMEIKLHIYTYYLL